MMGIRVRYTTEPELVVPKTEDLEIDIVSYADVTGYQPPVDYTTQGSGGAGNGAGAPSEWVDFTIGIDLSAQEKVVAVVTKTLKTLDKITNIFVVILKVLRILFSDLKNISVLLKMALKLIVKQLKAMIEGLTSVGMYACLIHPDFDSKRKKYALPIYGGYQEYIKRVNNSLLNSKDPGAPKFGDADTVGGIFIASIAGTNDPDILVNLIHNFEILGKFFNFKAMSPEPPKTLRAVPGYYYKDGKNKKGDPRYLGVKLTWTHTGDFASGFEVTRNIGSDKGTYLGFFKDGEFNSAARVKIPEGADPKDYVKVQIFDNKDFNNGEPVDIPCKMYRTKYEYIDFEVVPNELYFYKLYTFLGQSSTDFFEDHIAWRDLNSPVASSAAFATPVAKIPLSALSDPLYDSRGWKVNPPLDLVGEWKSISMRTFLGPAIDKLFSKIDNIADTLEGAITTGSGALYSYIKFMEKKIKKILKILDTIEDIIKMIAQLSFKGTVAILKLPPEVGGMRGLASRFNAANSVPSTPDNQNPFYGADEKGIMFGLTLVFGFPAVNGEYFQKYFEPVVGVGESGERQIKQSIKSMETVLGLLGLSSK